jgi:hypothetical protein
MKSKKDEVDKAEGMRKREVGTTGDHEVEGLWNGRALEKMKWRVEEQDKTPEGQNKAKEHHMVDDELQVRWGIVRVVTEDAWMTWKKDLLGEKKLVLLVMLVRLEHMLPMKLMWWLGKEGGVRALFLTETGWRGAPMLQAGELMVLAPVALWHPQWKKSSAKMSVSWRMGVSAVVLAMVVVSGAAHAMPSSN